jgi:membrane associated rhomboid family serine protease
MRSLRRQIENFNRRWAGGRFSVVAVLIAANTGMFAFQLIADRLIPAAGGIPWTGRWLALSGDGVRSGMEWQFFSYMFLHDGLMHLLFNMLTFYFAGREVEIIARPGHLLGMYFGGGLVGGVAQVLLSNPHTPLVGASAGVCATLIAFTTIYPEMELTLLLFFVIPVRVKAKYLALGLVGVSLVFAFTGAWGSVGHIAHLGGCVVGWLYARHLGFGAPLRLRQFFMKKRELDERRDRMTAEQFISEEIDPILDKISREGIHSLTRAERKILEKGREKIAKKTTRR